MKNLTRIQTLVAVLGLAATVSARADEWGIDPAHSAAQFGVRHMMISTVRGSFGGVNGTIEWDGKDAKTIKVDATIDVTTINTREPKRDEHLKSPDFFDATKFPKMTFKSKRVEGAGDGKLKLVGDLTIKGVTKEVVLDVDGPTPPMKNPWGRVVSGATASTKINRTDFGLNWNKALETGGVLVGDEIAITIDLEIGKKEAAPASR